MKTKKEGTPSKKIPNRAFAFLKEKISIKSSEGMPFYIVGMGGSAGGLDAFGQFFANMPTDSGMAFVFVSHLDPTQKA